MRNDVSRLNSFYTVETDIVTMLNYAETDKRGSAMEKAFSEVSNSLSFFKISK